MIGGKRLARSGRGAPSSRVLPSRPWTKTTACMKKWTSQSVRDDDECMVAFWRMVLRKKDEFKGVISSFRRRREREKERERCRLRKDVDHCLPLIYGKRGDGPSRCRWTRESDEQDRVRRSGICTVPGRIHGTGNTKLVKAVHEVVERIQPHPAFTGPTPCHECCIDDDGHTRFKDLFQPYSRVLHIIGNTIFSNLVFMGQL